MPNAIEYAKIYVDNLQKIWKKDSLTRILENDELVRTIAGAGANVVNLPKIDMDALADYSRSSGFSNGDSSVTFVPKQLKQDRGTSFTIDSVDDLESLGILGARLLSEFQRTKVTPEVDAFRFAKIAQGSDTSTRAYGAIASGADALSAITTAQLTLKNNEVPSEDLVLFCTPAFYQFLKAGTDSQRFYRTNEASINRDISVFDNMPVIEVPTTRFYAGWAKGASNKGYVNDGSAINFMIVHKEAILPVIKHSKIRIFDPDENQNADGWKIDYRIYHDCFVAPNKAKGIFVHTATEFSAGSRALTDAPEEA